MQTKEKERKGKLQTPFFGNGNAVVSQLQRMENVTRAGARELLDIV